MDQVAKIAALQIVVQTSDLRREYFTGGQNSYEPCTISVVPEFGRKITTECRCMMRREPTILSSVGIRYIWQLSGHKRLHKFNLLSSGSNDAWIRAMTFIARSISNSSPSSRKSSEHSG